MSDMWDDLVKADDSAAQVDASRHQMCVGAKARNSKELETRERAMLSSFGGPGWPIGFFDDRDAEWPLSLGPHDVKYLKSIDVTEDEWRQLVWRPNNGRR